MLICIVSPTHSCDVKCRWDSVLQVHDHLAELVEEFTLQRFGKEIADHLLSGTIIDLEFIAIDVIGDKIVATL